MWCVCGVAGFIGRTIGRPEYDWKFLTAPQTRVDDRRIFLPRGKGVGGSSLVGAGITPPPVTAMGIVLTFDLTNRSIL